MTTMLGLLPACACAADDNARTENNEIKPATSIRENRNPVILPPHWPPPKIERMLLLTEKAKLAALSFTFSLIEWNQVCDSSSWSAVRHCIGRACFGKCICFNAAYRVVTSQLPTML